MGLCVICMIDKCSLKIPCIKQFNEKIQLPNVIILFIVKFKKNSKLNINYLKVIFVHIYFKNIYKHILFVVHNYL